jgi:uroporphyrinogen decarboxylase
MESFKPDYRNVLAAARNKRAAYHGNYARKWSSVFTQTACNKNSLAGYENLCYIAADDPKLYADLFRRVGEVILVIWSRFVKNFRDIFSVLCFGDDLGFKSSTLLDPEDIRRHLIPPYRRIIELVHSCNIPFLLHSCGCIFSVMEDLIETAGIDAKHSNEDSIAPFSIWVERYGQRIGNFGGVDTDVLCQMSEKDIRTYVRNVIVHSTGHGGFAVNKTTFSGAGGQL